MAAIVETVPTAMGVARKRSSGKYVWTGGTESTTPQLFRTGDTAQIIVNYTSGTLQIQTAAVGTSDFQPYFVEGSADIAADCSVPFAAFGDLLLRITATGAAAATVYIQRGT